MILFQMIDRVIRSEFYKNTLGNKKLCMSKSKKRKTIFKIYQAIELQNSFMIESLIERCSPPLKGDLMKQKILLYFSALFFITPQLHSKFINVADEDQYKNMLSDNKHVLIKFSADWCSVCNGIKKPFEEIAEEEPFKKNVTLAQVDVDKLDSISKQNGIVGVPTFVYIENGSKKIEEIGVQSMPSFKDHLRDNLKKTFQIAQNDTDMSMTMDQPMVGEETVTVDIETPVAPPAEPNIFMRIINGIKNFITLIFTKIKEFFTTIVDAIKGFFGS